MQPITEAGDLKGKRVLVRVDWNVPFKDGKPLNNFRIKASLPTLEFLNNAGAKVTIATHLETGDIELLKQFVPAGMELLPNLRENPGEESNSEEFAKELASKADVFVNEAFSVSHREHASIVGVPKYLPHYAGLEFMKEVESLSKAFNPPHPFLIILGGAKVETKLPLIQKFLDIADEIFIAGAMAKTASEMPFATNAKISFPLGDIAALDADEANLELLKKKIASAQFIIWNGPLGKYEAGFKEGTIKLAQMLSENGSRVIVGGGDTLAVIEELNILNKFLFVSTAGGAMLDFLATGTLPGIEALSKK
ncbi:MAG: phosphoglycerate kinase [bacterium]|nr:phosphoglycerate kinase [bacterium]